MKNKNQSLKCDIEDDQLVIRIGIKTLEFAAEHCPLFYNDENNADPPYVHVVNRDELARDVKRELFHEREDGSSPISDVVDRAIQAAFEDGSEAFEYE